MIELVIAFAGVAVIAACAGFAFGRIYERQYLKDEQAMASETWRIAGELGRIVNEETIRLSKSADKIRAQGNTGDTNG